MPEYYTYMVRCADGSLYTGFSTNVEVRVSTHNIGKGAKYTRSRLPVKLVYKQHYWDASSAKCRESAIKRLTKAQKEKLIGCDLNIVLDLGRAADDARSRVSGYSPKKRKKLLREAHKNLGKVARVR